VAHFRVIASEVVGVNFLAISLETFRCAQQLTNLFMFLYQKGVRSQKGSHQVTLSAVHWQVAPLHQPLSPTTSSVVPGVSSSPRTLFSERHFWGAVRTLTLATVLSCTRVALGLTIIIKLCAYSHAQPPLGTGSHGHGIQIGQAILPPEAIPRLFPLDNDPSGVYSHTRTRLSKRLFL
jgi:hypothetical protein